MGIIILNNFKEYLLYGFESVIYNYPESASGILLYELRKIINTIDEELLLKIFHDKHNEFKSYLYDLENFLKENQESLPLEKQEEIIEILSRWKKNEN